MIKLFEDQSEQYDKELTMDILDTLYCDVDDFNKQFYPEWEKQQLESGKKKRRKNVGKKA